MNKIFILFVTMIIFQYSCTFRSMTSVIKDIQNEKIDSIKIEFGYDDSSANGLKYKNKNNWYFEHIYAKNDIDSIKDEIYNLFKKILIIESESMDKEKKMKMKEYMPDFSFIGIRLYFENTQCIEYISGFHNGYNGNLAFLSAYKKKYDWYTGFFMSLSGKGLFEYCEAAGINMEYSLGEVIQTMNNCINYNNRHRLTPYTEPVALPDPIKIKPRKKK